MGITVYSIVVSVIFFNVALLAAFIMRRSNSFLAKRTPSFLALMVLLGIIRLITPIDFDNAIIIRSYEIIPLIEDCLSISIVGSFSIGLLLLSIWLVGIVIFVGRDVAQQIRFNRVSRSYPLSDRRDLLDMAADYGSNFGVFVSTSISRPYVTGLFRPVIYLPDVNLSEGQWKTVFHHEVQHIRSCDEWKKLFFLAIQALFWWNPLAHISRKDIDTIIELQCDSKVTAGMSNGEVDTYLETLKLLMDRVRDHPTAVLVSPMTWDTKQMESRFQAMQASGSSRKTNPNAAFFLVLFAIFLFSYFVIVQPIRLAGEEDLTFDLSDQHVYFMPSVPEDTSEMYIVHIDGQYYLYIDGVRINSLEEEKLAQEPFCSLEIKEESK